MPIKDYPNIHAMVKETVDRLPNQAAYRWFVEAGRTESVTWLQFYEQVKQVAKSLIALGVKKNDKVNIISYTCYRWVLADVGITSIGACTVGIYHSNLTKDCHYLINHSDAVLIFAEDETQLKKVLEIRKEIPNIRKVILFKGTHRDDWVMSFDEFLKLGKDVPDTEFQKRVNLVTPQDPAGIVYTSGTTGIPKGGLALKIFRWACKVGNTVSDCQLNKQPISAFTKLQYRLATKLVFHKIQDALGGRVRWCISGAAPLSPIIGKFFHSAGVLILEGIGMTENTSFTNANRYGNYRFGWVGPPGPGIEQKIAPDGEILYRGRNVMKGYYKMPAETAETITPEGWLRTGDLGEIGTENFLRITGRKKELIITSGGKNIAPTRVEGLLAMSKYIGQVCVLGDRRQFLVALITLNPDNVKAYAQENGIGFTSIDDLIKNERIIRLVESEVEGKNKGLASFESIKKVKIVPEFTIENGLLTPTLKVKKNLVAEKYKQEIEAMYAGNGALFNNFVSQPAEAVMERIAA